MGWKMGMTLTCIQQTYGDKVLEQISFKLMDPGISYILGHLRRHWHDLMTLALWIKGVSKGAFSQAPHLG